MVLRDKLNSTEGYLEIIKKKISYVNEDLIEINELKRDEESGVQNNNRTNIEIIEDTKKDILSHKRTILEGRYSIGEDVNTLIESSNEILNLISEIWQSAWGYVQMVDALSIAIMFDIEDEAFDKLVALVDRDNVEDRLIDLLIASRKPDRPIAQKFLWNKPYKDVSAIVDAAKESNDSALEQLKKYLKAWYCALEVKTHESKWNIHTGYWSWEAGALAKILGLDDSALKDEPYYPYDMVHYKDS